MLRLQSWRRIVGTGTAMLFVALLLSPVLSAFQGSAVRPESCCRTKRSCCCKQTHDHNQGPEWAAARECQRTCVTAWARPSQTWGGAAPARLDQRRHFEALPAAPEHPGYRDPAFLAFLYQRPPPGE